MNANENAPGEDAEGSNGGTDLYRLCEALIDGAAPPEGRVFAYRDLHINTAKDSPGWWVVYGDDGQTWLDLFAPANFPSIRHLALHVHSLAERGRVGKEPAVPENFGEGTPDDRYSDPSRGVE